MRVWWHLRAFLKRVAAERQSNDGLARGLLSAERIRDVEFLARQDLAGSEEDLEPGA
jgi:hypothetical protein